jgi:hypothetical protein
MDPLLGAWLAIRHATVDKQKMAGGFQDSGHLMHKSVPVAEMVRRHPAAHKVE